MQVLRYTNNKPTDGAIKMNDRTNKTLIAWIEELQKLGKLDNLETVNIPETATDWEILEDGHGGEFVIYVVMGQLRFLK